jgi:N-acetylneuraminic acid mutarotase
MAACDAHSGRKPTNAGGSQQATTGSASTDDSNAHGSAKAQKEPSDPAPIRSVSGDLLDPMPRAVTSFGAAVTDDAVYTLGGYFGVPHEYSREGQSASLTRLSLEDGGTWEQLPGLDEGVQGLALVSHDGKLYRIGGTRHHNAAGEPSDMESLTEFASFDPETGSWTAGPALPQGRSSHGAAVIDGTVYVAGGWKLDGKASSAEWHDTLWMKDLTDDSSKWRSVKAPFKRRAVGVASAGGKLVVVGGMAPGRSISSRVDVFDPETEQWSRGPDYPGWGFGVSAGGNGEAVFVSGRDGVVHRFNPGESQWTRAATTAFPRFFHEMVASPSGELYVLGGISGMGQGRTRHVERVGPGDGAGKHRISSVTLPNQSAAKNRQGNWIRNHTLYVFGGNNSLGQHAFGADKFVSEAHALHLPSLTWKSMADFPVKRQSMRTVLGPDGKRGYAVGGFGHDGKSARSHGDLFVYDFEKQQWHRRPAGLPEPRTQIGLAQHGQSLWVFGGLDYDRTRPKGEHFRHLASVLQGPVDDPKAEFEEVDAPLPRPRRAFAGARLDGRYYVVGGMREEFQLVEGTLAFDFGEQSWQQVPGPRQTRLSAQLVPFKGKLYLIGGSVRKDGEMQQDRSIEVYDPETQTWSVLVEELPWSTRHMDAFAYHHRLLLYSAHHKDPTVRIGLVQVD